MPLKVANQTPQEMSDEKLQELKDLANNEIMEWYRFLEPIETERYNRRKKLSKNPNL